MTHLNLEKRKRSGRIHLGKKSTVIDSIYLIDKSIEKQISEIIEKKEWTMGYDFMFEKAKDIFQVSFPCEYGEFELVTDTFPWKDLKNHIYPHLEQ